MSQADKLKQRLLSKPKDFTYDELKRVLKSYGFIEINKGKTSGSRMKFYNEKNGGIILLHKPHPGNIIKPYLIDIIIEKLTEMGELS